VNKKAIVTETVTETETETTTKKSQEKMSTTTIQPCKGAAVIIWDKNEKGEIGVLVGKESVYLTDIILEGDCIEDLQRYYIETDANDITAAKIHFMTIAAKLSVKYKMEIRYDVPEQVEASGGELPYYHVNFRCLPVFDDLRKGVIKGGCEAVDANPMDTVLREIREELGLDIKSKYLHSLGEGRKYDLFSLPLHEMGDRRVVSVIIDRISQRKKGHSGEVFDLKFVNFTQIPDLSQYNAASREIIQRLFQTMKIQ
jgi:8-oxo-dGTP pyrophosphatase MutT (NUDIX family)